MLKNIVLAVICGFIFTNASAQNEEVSRWSVSGSAIPHLIGYGINFPPTILGITFINDHDFSIKPAAQIKAEYRLFKEITLQGGLGCNMSLLGIGYNDPTIYFLELPMQVNWYLIDRRHFQAYISVGDVSSYINAKAYAYEFPILQENINPKVQTIDYQNYLQFALGFQLKTSPQWCFYLSPLYRLALINYKPEDYETNLFSKRMLGLEIGAKYNFLKKSAN